MRRRILSITLMGIFAVMLSAAHAEADEYIIFQVKDLKGYGGTHLMAMPEIFKWDETLTLDKLINVIFTKLKATKSDVYGTTTIQPSGKLDGSGKLIIALDTTKADNYPIILGELYYTFKFNGVNTIEAPAIKTEPLDTFDIPVIGSTQFVNFYEALPPAKLPGVTVQWQSKSGIPTTMPTDKFYAKIAAGSKPIINRMVKALKKGTKQEKLEVLEAMATVELPGAEDLLIELLDDPDKELKLIAIDKLEAKPTKKVIDALAKVADTESDAALKSKVVKILDAAGVEKYKIFTLFDELKSPNDSIVLEALNKLIKSGNAKVVPGLATVLGHYNKEIRQKALDGIIGFKDFDELSKALPDTKIPPDTREAIAKALVASESGKLVEQGLIHLLGSNSVDTITWSLEEIKKRKLTATADKLIPLLGHADATIRHAAAKLLGEFAYEPALQPLAKASTNLEDNQIMSDTVIAIISKLSLDQVVKQASAEDLTLRKLAVKALAEFTKGKSKINPTIQKVLEEKLADSDKSIKSAAVFALAKTTDPSIVAKLVPLKDDPEPAIRAQVVYAVSRANVPEAKDIIMAKIDDPDDEVRRQAIIGVRLKGLTDALEKLRWMAGHKKVEVKREVIHTLAELMQPEDHKKLFDVFSNALFDLDSEVKIWAITGIAKIKDPRTVPNLSSLVTDKDEEVKLKALDALASTKDPGAVEHIVAAFFDPSEKVKYAALDALAKLNVEQARKPLQELIKNETDPKLKQKAEEVWMNLP